MIEYLINVPFSIIAAAIIVLPVYFIKWAAGKLIKAAIGVGQCIVLFFIYWAMLLWLLYWPSSAYRYRRY